MRRSVISIGLAAAAFGVWLLFQVHSRVGGCTVATTAGGTGTGIDSSCARTILAYGEGAIFIAAGLMLAIIAARMIAQRERRDLRGELRSVPRSWKTPLMVLNSSSEDVSDRHVLHSSYVSKAG